MSDRSLESLFAQKPTLNEKKKKKNVKNKGGKLTKLHIDIKLISLALSLSQKY